VSAQEPVTDLLEQGDELASRNEPAKALAHYDRALKLDRENTGALERKVLVLMGQGREDDALDCQRELVALDPDNVERRIDLASLLLVVEGHDAAIDCLEEALRVAPSDHRILQRLGLAYHSCGRPDRALDAYERALSLAPEDGSLWAAKADVLIDTARPDEGEEALEHAARVDPEFSEADWNLRAHRYYMDGEAERAARLYRRAIEVRSNVASWRGLGLTCQATGNVNKALQCYEAGLELEPENVQLLNDRGFMLLEQSNMTEAQACFRRVVELAPESIESWLNLGWTYRETGEPAAALDAYTRASRLDPDRAEIWTSLGVCELEIGERDAALRKALRSFELAAELDEHEYWAWNNAGWVLGELDRYEDAITRLDQAIDLDRSESTAWSNKMHLLLEHGDLEDAVRCVEEMGRAVSDPAIAMATKAQILTDWLGRDEEALELSREAARLMPDELGITANIAETLLKLGRYGEARKTAEQLLGEVPVVNIRCAMRFVVWASLVLEHNQSEARARAFAEFMELFREHYLDGADQRLDWNFRGVRRALADQPTSEEERFLLTVVIDLQEGKLPAEATSFFSEEVVDEGAPAPH